MVSGVGKGRCFAASVPALASLATDHSPLTTHHLALTTLASEQKVYIVGIGDDGLEGATSAARRLIEQAQLLIGAESTLARLGGAAGKAQRLTLGEDLAAAVGAIAGRAGQRI